MKNKKLKKINKLLAAGIFILTVVFCPLFSHPAEAAWGEFVQEQFHFVLQRIYDNAQGMIMGALKQQAVTMLNGQIDVLLSGDSGNARFIINWEDYLIAQPENETRVYMNDYLSQMTAGRGSLTGYRSEGFSGSGNYIAGLGQSARASGDARSMTPHPTYEGDPSQMFASGNFKNFNLYLSGVNNPWAFNMAYENEYQKVLEEKKAARQAEAVANQGVRSTYSADGKTVTYPGSLVKETVANIQNLPNLVIANAQSVAEVINASVSQLITGAMQQGFSGMQRSVQKTTGVQQSIDAERSKAYKASGPGAQYGNGASSVDAAKSQAYLKSGSGTQSAPLPKEW